MYHLTIDVYDWFLTIDSELAFIWDPKWNLGTLLYFLTRYPTFIDTAVLLYSAAGYSIPPPVCNIVIVVSYWMFLFGISVAEVIMMTCLYTLSDAHSWSTWLAIIHPDARPKDLPPDAPGCQDIVTSASVGTHDKTFIDFLALTSLEVVLFLLMLSKAVEHSRSHSSAFVIECFRHGLLYYMVLSVLSVINLAIIVRATEGVYDPWLSIQRTFHAILSARMLLHLKRSARQTSGANTSSTSPGSDIVFQDANSMGSGQAMEEG
ncbi:hypothetical protein BD779DRAFT_1568372, partial [Infundibulicybe gibba]